MNKLFFLAVIMLLGCNNLKYKTESGFNPRTHNFSYTEISDSSLMFKRVQVNLPGDSIINGKITGILKDRIMISTQLKRDTLSVPFMEIKSFQVSGFPLPYYSRSSFGIGFSGTFILFISPYIINTVNNTKTPNSYNQTPEMTIAYMGVGLLGGFLLSNYLDYNQQELENQIVTIFVE